VQRTNSRGLEESHTPTAISAVRSASRHLQALQSNAAVPSARLLFTHTHTHPVYLCVSPRQAEHASETAWAALGWGQLSKRSETGPYVAFLNSTGRAAHGSALVDLPDGTLVSVWCSQGEGNANTSIVMARLALGTTP
jgi:hypothetical protein